jgi:gamma-glutamyltranspeptidase/glutathione hydrolase
MAEGEKGVVAAGHPLTAQAGARVLREGGNAVDATIAAMLTSFVAEPLLTGLGAGGYMLVGGGGEQPSLLDFFVQAPSNPRHSDPADDSIAELEAINVSFGDAAQVFHIGPASCGVYGTPAGVCEAVRRWGTLPLEDLVAPAVRLARDGVELNAGQAYVAEILADLLTSTPECAALWAPEGHVLREGEVLRNGELGDALRRLASDGAEPFYEGDVAAAVSDWLGARCSPTRRRRPAGRSSHTRWRCSIAARRRRRFAMCSARCGPPSQSGRRTSWRGSARRASSSAFSPRAWGRRRTSPRSMPRVARVARRAPTARARASSCRARGCT